MEEGDMKGRVTAVTKGQMQVSWPAAKEEGRSIAAVVLCFSHDGMARPLSAGGRSSEHCKGDTRAYKWLLLQHPDYAASLEGAGRVFSTQCWCASSLLCFALSDNYHAHYPKVWKQTKQKTHREEMQSHFRWCLDVSILCESSHVTKLSRSHLKSFQFVNKKSFQRSHLHNAYGYSYIKVEGYPTFFLLMPCIQS